MAETETKKRTGLGALADAGNTDDFSVIDAIGGPRGVIESILPGVVFVLLFVITSNLQLTIGVSAALAVLQVIVRLCQRQSVMGSVSGLLAVGICLIWAWNSHEARNYYMFGFLTNAFYVVFADDFTAGPSAWLRIGHRVHQNVTDRAFSCLACRLAR